MEDFNVELAVIPFKVRCRYGKNRAFFEGYFTEKEPYFTIEPTDEDIAFAEDGFKRLNETEGFPQEEYDDCFLENNAIHILAIDKLIEYNVLMLHGSALAMDGQGIIFTAKSGTGKSTHAKLWRELFGSRVQMINDDKPMIRVDEMKAYGTPWNGKHNLSTNTSVPIKAIVKIERAKKNRINPIGVKEAMDLLMKQVQISNDPDKVVLALELYARVIENVKFYKLGCNMDPEAARVAWEELIGPRNAFEYLDTLRSQNTKQRYSKVMDYIETKARKMGVPLVGQFELTPLCNLDCKMCYVHLSGDRLRGQKLLSTEQWKDLMKQAFSAGMMDAVLTGGECLTYPGFDELYLYLQSLGIQSTVMTNGVLLDEKRLDFFREHPPAWIQVTLYGNSEDAYERVTGHRVFSMVLSNLKKVKEYGLPLSINITPNSILGEDIFETIRLARSLTDDIIISTSLFTLPGEEWRLDGLTKLDDEFIARILRFDKELRGKKIREIPESELPEPGGPKNTCTECGLECGGGRSNFVLDWKGNLRICNRLETKSFSMTDGFLKSWKEINRIANNWPRVTECKGCAYEKVCDNCAAKLAQYAEPGKYPKEYCRRTRLLVSRGVLPPPEC